MLNKNLLNNPFAFSSRKLSASDLFDNIIELDYGYFYYNDETLFSTVNLNNTKLILIGYILDTRDGQKDRETILYELISRYVCEEKKIFYEYLDFLNGRYVMLFSNQDDTSIYTDATSMSPVFYYKNILISSHEILLRMMVEREYGRILEVSEFRMKNFLDYTDTEELYSFNPNLYYSAKNQEFIRYFPRKQFKIQPLSKVIENTEKLLLNQLDWLKLNYRNIYLSLTGGYDSRLSLAIVKPIIDEINTFTYMYDFSKNDNYQNQNKHKRIYYMDKVIVDNLVDNFNLIHEYFYFSDYEVPSQFIKDLAYHVSSHHSYKLSYLFNEIVADNAVHIKSTLYELCKLPQSEFYDLKSHDSNVINSIKQWAPAEIRENYDLIYKMFQDYLERNLITDIIDYDYDILLMLYWEYRMGNWHSSLTQETDFLVDTFVFINSRYLINQLISLSVEDKNKKSYLTTIVRNNWPALNYFVPNTFHSLEDLLNQ